MARRLLLIPALALLSAVLSAGCVNAAIHRSAVGLERDFDRFVSMSECRTPDAQKDWLDAAAALRQEIAAIKEASE